MMDVPFGFRFNPTEEELISYYLKNKIMGIRMSDWEYGLMLEGQLYGENTTPWEILTYDNEAIPWHSVVDSMGKLEVSERVVYVFTKLSNVGKTGKSVNKQKNRVAGCGTWHGNTAAQLVFDNNGRGNRTIGTRRTFTFRSTAETVGQWTMYEYAIDAAAHGIADGMNGEEYVLCRIKRNDSKSSKDGKIVSRKRKASSAVEYSCDEQSANKERSEASTSYNNADQTQIFSAPSNIAFCSVDNSDGMYYAGLNQQDFNVSTMVDTYFENQDYYSGVNEGNNIITMDQQ